MHQPEETLAQVLRYARLRGYLTSRPQIRRYQQSGLIPKPKQVGRGRGRGSETIYPSETGEQLVAARKALKSRSLSTARWRLWWDGRNVQPEVVKADLQRLLRKQKRGSRKLPRNMQRRLGRHTESFHKVFARLRSEGSANAPRNEDLHERIVARAYGLDSVRRIQSSGNLPPPDLLALVAGIARAIAPEALEVALKNATTEDLLLARNELYSLLARLPEFLRLLDTFGNPVLEKLVTRAFSPFIELSPREQQLALIGWIGIRNYPQVKSAYARFPGMLEVMRDEANAPRST
jgi:hypothetical protein